MTRNELSWSERIRRFPVVVAASQPLDNLRTAFTRPWGCEVRYASLETDGRWRFEGSEADWRALAIVALDDRAYEAVCGLRGLRRRPTKPTVLLVSYLRALSAYPSQRELEDAVYAALDRRPVRTVAEMFNIYAL